jgi:hypothetical protein
MYYRSSKIVPTTCFFFKLPAKLHNYLEMSKYLSKNFDFSSYRGRFCGGRGNENRQKSLAMACQSDKFD